MTYIIKNSLYNIIYENYVWFYAYNWNRLNCPNDYNIDSLTCYKINIQRKYYIVLCVL